MRSCRKIRGFGVTPVKPAAPGHVPLSDSSVELVPPCTYNATHDINQAWSNSLFRVRIWTAEGSVEFFEGC
jgi:hypothetical protein